MCLFDTAIGYFAFKGTQFESKSPKTSLIVVCCPSKLTTVFYPITSTHLLASDVTDSTNVAACADVTVLGSVLLKDISTKRRVRKMASRTVDHI